MKITVHGIEFKTKKALKQRVREIRDSCSKGSSLIPEHREFMLSLFENHPKSAEKLSAGVKDMIVDTPDEWKSVKSDKGGFTIIRPDGTRESVSFPKCIDDYQKSKITKVSEAARYAVRDKTITFLDGRDGIVHHADPWPFRKIVSRFMEEWNLEYDDIELLEDLPGMSHIEFADSDLSDRFYDLHDRLAILQFKTHEEHMEEHYGKKASARD